MTATDALNLITLIYVSAAMILFALGMIAGLKT